MTTCLLLFALFCVAYTDWLLARLARRRRINERPLRVAAEVECYVYSVREPLRWVDRERARA